MKAHVIIQFRIPVAQGRLLKEAAKRSGLKLAAWVREAAILTAEDNPELQRTRDWVGRPFEIEEKAK